jgi:hypothetical protein
MMNPGGDTWAVLRAEGLTFFGLDGTRVPYADELDTAPVPEDGFHPVVPTTPHLLRHAKEHMRRMLTTFQLYPLTATNRRMPPLLEANTLAVIRTMIASIDAQLAESRQRSRGANTTNTRK